ncbi:hypothetical protein PROFUN_04183 [Planoprotostelium fungivorum]|uniref:LamG-like jellyroll fold domain-containing protein n=1 Tax=Planoprotostelium fungivorum TaxID=1890364 RepID=A0A2P6NVV7_9EUKA|nr:hypothetical protein PROFUN_04183 [Planoprotostelium fungivorum]
MRNAITLLLLLALSTAAWADTCQAGYSWCSGINACYDSSQYNCNRDQYHGQNRLCAAGTVSCNDVCIASCAYKCGSDGWYTVKSDRTCPPPPACVNDNMMACGAACYDKSKFCCVSGQPQEISTCPQPTSPICDITSNCPFGIYNVGSLPDGQLRMNYGPGALSVSFTLSAGALYDLKGQRCYISSSGQLQCNQVPQTSDTFFGISGDFLSRNGNLVWYYCAVGTGGSNLYARNIDSVACSATYLYVTLSCPTVPTSPSTKPITSTSPPPTKPPVTTSYVPSTSSIPPTTAPCVPGGVTIPIPFCYFSFDFGIFGGLLKDDSGRGRHATCLGQPKSIEGKSKLALGFDFSLGFQGLRLDQTAGLDGDFSVATWLKIQDSDKVMKIVSTKKGLFSLLTGWELSLCPKTKTVTFVSGFSSVSWRIDLSVDVWFHLAFTAEKSGKVNLYINGVAGATQWVFLSKCSGSLYIASDKSNCNFKGAFDDFLLFDLCLSVQHVISIISNRCVPATVPSTTKVVTSLPPLPPPSSTVAPPPPPPSTKPPGKKCGLPWLYWSFDKIKQGRCSDDSGHGRHGWFSSDYSLVPGKLRQGCNWKNNNNLHITLSQCELHKSFTIATWLRLDSIGGKNVLASTKSLFSGWELSFDGNAKLITFQSSLGSWVGWDASSLRVGVWVHVAIAISFDHAELYLDGNSCGYKPIASCHQSFIGLSVGGKLWANPLHGTLDEFLMFDRVLDKEQICDARDKYQTGSMVSGDNWSKQTESHDWGVGWEFGGLLSGLGLNRLHNWWIF